ncbi:unnamed protein product [Rotaria magnacalcarata]|uniref:Uncharacterized protein n=1 Tax=Rotaria magnacalcarata TaxID=392030 RepID=A0A815NXE0_9BILA|nr:unnamed protein product [Rotaria magnacalcarata]CAF1521029.1 unnamed protein product [Rotaria magnacalcarata]CAF3801853.1 unnamed protein product [Rotaria magnacalcarata]CAF3861183.1 unnamed protein product [Rotaria magnacalcarata]CAF4085006.1 unnamed protein product [Rotaria magnacalcarata]
MGIHYRKKSALRYTEKQIEQVPTRARRLYRTLLNNDFELIMDDEKYFTLTNESMSNNRGFYTSDPSTSYGNNLANFRRKGLWWWLGSQNDRPIETMDTTTAEKN